MRILTVAAVMAAALGAASPALAIDPFFPEFGNNGIDVEDYLLELDVSPKRQRIDATARISITALRSLDAFRLDLSGLRVSSVLIEGQPASFRQKNGKLIIEPSAQIARGARFNVAVAYGGSPKALEDPTFEDPTGEYKLGWQWFGNASHVLSEPVGASTFYPANDEPTDKATFRFEITVPEGYTAVANGVLDRARTVAGGKRFSWRMDQPMTTWLATVQVNNKYDALRVRTASGLPIRVYTTPGAGRGDADSYAKVRKMIPFIESIAGPYPFESYGSVTVDDPGLYYALETQGMSTFPAGWADQSVVMHEVAHQWFGNAVTIENWADIWIAEGYATYFEFLWPNRNNPAAFDNTMRSIYAYLVNNNISQPVVADGTQIFSPSVYYRGAVTLYALRLEIGEANFNTVTRTFVERFKNKNASTQDFISTAIEVTGDDTGHIREFLNDWLYRPPVPALPGGSSKVASSAAPVALPESVWTRCGPFRHRGAPACADGKAAAAAD